MLYMRGRGKAEPEVALPACRAQTSEEEARQLWLQIPRVKLGLGYKYEVLEVCNPYHIEDDYNELLKAIALLRASSPSWECFYLKSFFRVVRSYPTK